ncbi:MAG: curlin [Flavobacteriaceae bacterium]|nr:curlin [Flavobacteriaceae bacterium]
MKKVVLSAMALMFGAIMVAQNDPITDTSGDMSPDVKIEPSLSLDPLANTGKSVQFGDGNKVRVRQAGSSQSVSTVQDNGSGLGGNLARIMQTGAVGPNSGVANAAEVLQSGTANQSTTVQEGDENWAITRQGQKNDASSGNKAKIRQGTGQQAESNYAAIDQDGDNNQAKIRQIFDNNDAWTQQVGNENKSKVMQNAGPNGSDGHSASVDQQGDRNESFVTQSGLGGRNTATLLQQGDDNKGKQYQTTDALVGSDGNRAGMQQGTLNQSWSLLPLTAGLLSDVGGIDPGNLPIYVSSLESFGAVGFQIQSGNENAADMVQAGGSVGDSNYGEQNQSGSGNEAAMVQGHTGAGGNNYAKQEQIGYGNYAGLGQSGSGFKALQTQYGTDNNVLSSQRGEGHLLNVHQRGNLNVATTAQAGLANRALVVQRDGQSYTVEQNLNLAGGPAHDLSAGGNQVDVLQLGPNGDFSTDGIDCYFDAQLDPTMDYTVPGFNLGDICLGGC